MFRPYITVVIPTYNRAQPTIQAIESVTAQTYRAVEILVIDDGSTDGSGEVVRQYVESKSILESDTPEMYYFCQKNQGPSVARNAGIERARGDYIAFLDSDDSWLPEKLESQVRTLELCGNECGACFTDTEYLTKACTGASTFRLFGRNYQETVGIERDATRLLAQTFCGFFISTLLVRSDLVRQIGGFDSKIGFAEDRDLYFRLSLKTSLAYIDKMLVRGDRNATPAGSSCRPWDEVEVRLMGWQNMYEKWLSDTALSPSIRNIVIQNLRKLHCDWANWHLHNSRYDEARRSVSRAVKYELTAKMAAKWVLTWIAPPFAKRLSGIPTAYL